MEIHRYNDTELGLVSSFLAQMDGLFDFAQFIKERRIGIRPLREWYLILRSMKTDKFSVRKSMSLKSRTCEVTADSERAFEEIAST